MDEVMKTRLLAARSQLVSHLHEGIMPFWTARGADPVYGGYLVCYDDQGNLMEDETDKHIVTQTRMIWGFSLFNMIDPENPQYREAARQGVDFFIDHFWDAKHEIGRAHV